ncbi:hypothetical protein [Marinomonas primoryensis]|jgi:hypothetical protein|uniref:Uncharacterized protein n=1 Tax=Marinomonas primoryensis TaxID=178399 RepID=A0A859CW47_9GAMM|nr:hypothetical protein [Marinomonas primoryensis]QKK80372.1 uncharacterized protein MP3633_1643 [Marinomonas primoryensis]
MHSLYAQPNLSEATTSKRFKGCYLLESVKVKITDTGWPIRVATIKDVQDQNSLELRLLGDDFLAINVFISDYIQLEAAVKRYRNGLVYYLAWYEPVTGFLMKPNTHGKDIVNQTDKKACLQILRQRILFFSSKTEQSLCFSILKNFSHDFSLYALQSLCQQLSNLNDNRLIVELVYQVEKQSDEIGYIGKLLDQLLNKQPYHILNSSV